MRIAMFVDSFPAVSETFILRQITGLADMGHEVDVYSETRPQDAHPTHPEVTEDGLLARTTYMDMPPEAGYWELPAWPATGRTWPPGSETSTLNAARLLRAAPRLLRCLAAAPRITFRVLDPSEYGYQARSLSALYRLSILCSGSRAYDALHAHFGPVGNSFRFARELWRAPLIVTFHGYDFSIVPRLEGRAVYDQLFAAADALTVNSEYARQRLEDLGSPPARIHRLNCGLDLGDFPFKARRRESGEPVRILTVGRLVEKKGIEYSIRAFGRVRAKHPELRYDVIGEGPLRTPLEELIDDLGLEKSVTLHGARDAPYVRHMMSQAHLFVLTSVTASDGDQEGTPVSLMEAQACGLPVLSSRHSGIPEIVLDGESGFLITERDGAAVADRLTYLVEHPEEWPAMGRRGREYAERHHDIRKLNEQLAELYQQAIDGYRSRRRGTKST